MIIMKKLIVFTFTLAISTFSFAKGSHHVRSYTKRDGTYVQSHRQTNPNKTQRDNWSAKGNTNPYTEKQGTKRVTK
jgi:hypothetical protein